MEAVNWNNCIICGESSKQDLRCPLNLRSTQTLEEKIALYETFLQMLRTLSENGIPADVKIDENTTAQQLYEKRASWHGACRRRFLVDRIEKKIIAHKRKSGEPSGSGEASGISDRTKIPRQGVDTSLCIICQEDSNAPTHLVQTLQASAKIQSMAQDLQDTKLMTRVVGSDLTVGLNKS